MKIDNKCTGVCNSCKKEYLTTAMFYGALCFGCQMKKDDDARKINKDEKQLT